MPTIDRIPVAKLSERRRRSTHVGYEYVQYSDEEIDFLRAMEAYKRDHRRPFPTWSEVLAILKSLGYRRVAPYTGVHSPARCGTTEAR